MGRMDGDVNSATCCSRPPMPLDKDGEFTWWRVARAVGWDARYATECRCFWAPRNNRGAVLL